MFGSKSLVLAFSQSALLTIACLQTNLHLTNDGKSHCPQVQGPCFLVHLALQGNGRKEYQIQSGLVKDDVHVLSCFCALRLDDSVPLDTRVAVACRNFRERGICHVPFTDQLKWRLHASQIYSYPGSEKSPTA